MKALKILMLDLRALGALGLGIPYHLSIAEQLKVLYVKTVGFNGTSGAQYPDVDLMRATYEDHHLRGVPNRADPGTAVQSQPNDPGGAALLRASRVGLSADGEAAPRAAGGSQKP